MGILSLIKTIDENHIYGEWSNICGFNVRLEDGGILLSSDTSFQLPGMSEMANTAFYSIDDVSLLTKKLKISLTEVLSEYVNEISNMIDELYRANSPSVLGLVFEDQGHFTPTCAIHIRSCGEIARKFVRMLMAILNDINHAANTASINCNIFDNFYLTREFNLGAMELVSYFSRDDYMKRLSLRFSKDDPLISPSTYWVYLSKSIVSKRTISELFELAKIRNYLYSGDQIKPIKLLVEHPQRDIQGDTADSHVAFSNNTMTGDTIKDIRMLLELLLRNHILFEEKSNGLIIESGSSSRTITIRTKETCYNIGCGNVRELPASLRKIVRDVLLKQIQGWAEVIQEWYRECAHAIINYSPSDTDRQYLTCCMHGDSCGELVTSVRRLILALVSSIEKAKITMEMNAPFEGAVLEKVIDFVSVVNFELRGSNLVLIDDLRELIVTGLMLDEDMRQSVRVLIDLWTALYRESVIEPFTLTIG